MSKYVGINECHNITGLTVVIDVLRAFTVVPLAISQGASEIVLVETLGEALRLKANTPGSLAFKDGRPEQGFDLFNSPGHLLDLDVAGRVSFKKRQLERALLLLPGTASRCYAPALSVQARPPTISACRVLFLPM